MQESFKSLIETSPLWLPALSWSLGQLSASKVGLKFDEEIKKRLKWIKDPEAEKAFHEAFNAGIQKYQTARSDIAVSQSVARVLVHVAEHDVKSLDRAIILEQIFADQVNSDQISGVVSRHIFGIEGIIISKDEVSKELKELIVTYLKPAFRTHHYFSEIVGFAEVIGLLKEIKDDLNPFINIESLQKDYCKKIADKYEMVAMQGISPKVQNRVIGIKMEDIYIPVHAKYIPLEGKRGNVLPDSKQESCIQTMLNRFSFQRTLASELVFTPSPIETSNIELTYSVIERLTGIYTDEIQIQFSKSINTLVKKIDWSSILEISLSLLGNMKLHQLLELAHIVIRGHPGTGKSTTIKYISWAIASRNFSVIGDSLDGFTPIIVRAIEFGENIQQGLIYSLDEFILKDAHYAPLFRFAISAGKAFIFIDGLDEVGQPALRAKVKERVDDFISDPAFSDNYLLITTRIVGYQPDGKTGTFPHFELKELDDSQIANFVESWYKAIHAELQSTGSIKTEKQQLLDAVLKNPSIHRMAQNPLLLTIIALIKWQGRALPEQRVQLYDAAAQTLIQSWPALQRDVKFDEIFVREWLAPIAKQIFENPTSDLMDEFTLTDELVNSMILLKAIPRLEARVETQKLLDSISVHSGIILPRGVDPDGRNLYGFLHQTFAEYLTAYYCVGKWEDGEFDLKTYAHDPYWREVLLLMAGHLGTQRRAKAGQFIQAIIAMKSSKYEEIIQRDLLLAGYILGDAVPAPAETVEKILEVLLGLWKTTRYNALRDEIEKVFRLIKPTEYGSVLARLASTNTLDDYQVIRLARVIGSASFEKRLKGVLVSTDLGNSADASILLLDTSNQEAVTELLISVNQLPDSIRAKKYKEILKLGNRGISRQAIGLLFDLKSEEVSETLEVTFSSNDCDGLLVECLASENPFCVMNAARLLARKKNSSAVEALINLLSSSASGIDKTQVAFSLAIYEAEEAVPFLQAALCSEIEEDQLTAASLLYQQYKDTSGKLVLMNLILSTSSRVAIDANSILRSMPDFSLTDDYIQLLLSTPSLYARLDFASTLFKEGIDAGREHLISQAHSTDTIASLGAASRILFAIHNDTPSRELAKAKLTELLNYSDSAIALQAANTLITNGESEVLERYSTFLFCLDDKTRYLAAAQLLAFAGMSNKAFNLFKKNLRALLKDTKPVNDPFLGLQDYSAADLAWRFINDNLTPGGKLVFKSRII